MKQKRVIAIIQARIGSTRLPGKVLKKIGEKSILEILITRLRKTKFLDEIVVATTIDKKDNVIAELSKKIGVQWYRGSEEDVLGRYVEAARAFNADIVVRITADNPLTDLDLMDKLIERHLESDADYTYCNDAPLGVSTEIINLSALEKADKNAKSQSEREHVTPYTKSHSEIFKIQSIESNFKNQSIRLTVDTIEDLKLMKLIYENLGNLEELKTEEVISFLERHPEFCKINAHVKQKIRNSVNPQEVKISVIIRTHNSANFVKNAVDSVLNQTLSKELYEILVIDDGSTDATKDILKNYGNKIRLIEGRELGAVKSANLGIENSRGEYVILLDSDDVFEPNALEEMLTAIQDSYADLVYCDYFEKDIENSKIKTISLKDNIFNSVAGGILFKELLLKDLGGYDESLIFPEYDLLIKLMRKKYKYTHVPISLFTYVRHKRSLTADKEIVRKGFKQLFDKYGEIKGLRKY
jgi:spore coat polysaccharide biosynthesis protein SpsF